MLLTVLVLGVMSSSEVSSPLQVCTGDRVTVERRYNMRAAGHVKCSVGDVSLLGGQATVTASADERTLELVVTDSAQAFRGRDRVTGDSISVTMERSRNVWVAARLVVEFSRWRMVPADPAR